MTTARHRPFSVPGALALVASLLLVTSARAAGGIATIASVSGGVQALFDGVEPWRPVSGGEQLTPGSQLKTDASGEAILLFSDSSKVRIGANSEFRLDDAQPKSISVFLSLGKLEAWVKKIRGRKFEARSPSAVASVRGTTFGMNVGADRATNFALYEGALHCADNFGHAVTLSPGHAVTAGGAGGFDAPKALPKGSAPPPEPKVTMAPPKPVPPGPGKGNAPPPPPPPPAFNDTGGMAPPPPPPNPQQNEQNSQPVSPSSPH